MCSLMATRMATQMVRRMALPTAMSMARLMVKPTAALKANELAPTQSTK
jgi:hypothetical protein